jgi:hypothetical protein
MADDRTMCVVCAWRATCNKKFSMDGATTTRCPDYTRDLTLKETDSDTSRSQDDDSERDRS